MSLIPPNMGYRSRVARFNPISKLTPQFLSQSLDLFDIGYLRNAGLLWEIIEDRDDTLQIAAPKRRKAVSRRPWEIITTEESAAADAHKEFLTDFFNNINCTDATDENRKGGVRLLIRQMMNAVFHQYAVHEIVWSVVGGKLRANLRYVPVYFFENRTGKLRFIGPEGGSAIGIELPDDEWLITCGDSALMKAASICYLFKKFSLNDWLNFSEKFGIPGIHGETPAAKGTKDFDDFVNALDAFANDWVTATSPGAKINLIEAEQSGEGPFAPMVERMDRRMASLCRGADLSTMSRTNAVGASLQEDEADILMEDDCEMISESLQAGLARFVIRWKFGIEPLAYIKILPPQEKDIEQEIKVDQFLMDNGGELDAQDTYERYGRNLPKGFPKGATLKATPQSPALPSPVTPIPENLVNDTLRTADDPEIGKLLAKSRDLFGEALANDFKPLLAAFREILKGDDATIITRTQELYHNLDAVAEKIIGAENSTAALKEILSASLGNGIAGEGNQKHKQSL